jgi:hypothetical protein
MKDIMEHMPAGVGLTLKEVESALKSAKSGRDDGSSICRATLAGGDAERRVIQILLSNAELSLGMDLGATTQILAKLCTRTKISMSMIYTKFEEIAKEPAAGPGAFLLFLVVKVMGKFLVLMGRANEGVLEKEVNDTVFKGGMERLTQWQLWIAVVSRILDFIEDEKHASHMPGCSLEKAAEGRASKTEKLIVKMALGFMEPKHQELVDEWKSEGCKRRATGLPPSGASPPKGASKGQSKAPPGLQFTHCIKYQHGHCAASSCPDGKMHVFVNCKRAHAAGQKCSKGDGCWFHHP